VFKICNLEECEDAIRTVFAEKSGVVDKKRLRIFLKTMEGATIISGFGDAEIPEDVWATFSKEEFGSYQGKTIGSFVKEVIDELNAGK
jgi:hypothetical protein